MVAQRTGATLRQTDGGGTTSLPAPRADQHGLVPGTAGFCNRLDDLLGAARLAARPCALPRRLRKPAAAWWPATCGYAPVTQQEGFDAQRVTSDRRTHAVSIADMDTLKKPHGDCAVTSQSSGLCVFAAVAPELRESPMDHADVLVSCRLAQAGFFSGRGKMRSPR